jgi:hypothetical protein
MGGREDARLAAWRAAATHVWRKAWRQLGGLEQSGKTISTAVAGGHSYRAPNCVARVRQTKNDRDFSGKMTRAANKLDVLDMAPARSKPRGEACDA